MEISPHTLPFPQHIDSLFWSDKPIEPNARPWTSNPNLRFIDIFWSKLNETDLKSRNITCNNTLNIGGQTSNHGGSKPKPKIRVDFSLLPALPPNSSIKFAPQVLIAIMDSKKPDEFHYLEPSIKNSTHSLAFFEEVIPDFLYNNSDPNAPKSFEVNLCVSFHKQLVKALVHKEKNQVGFRLLFLLKVEIIGEKPAWWVNNNNNNDNNDSNNDSEGFYSSNMIDLWSNYITISTNNRKCQPISDFVWRNPVQWIPFLETNFPSHPQSPLPTRNEHNTPTPLTPLSSSNINTPLLFPTPTQSTSCKHTKNKGKSNNNNDTDIDIDNNNNNTNVKSNNESASSSSNTNTLTPLLSPTPLQTSSYKPDTHENENRTESLQSPQPQNNHTTTLPSLKTFFNTTHSRSILNLDLQHGHYYIHDHPPYGIHSHYNSFVQPQNHVINPEDFSLNKTPPPIFNDINTNTTNCSESFSESPKKRRCEPIHIDLIDETNDDQTHTTGEEYREKEKIHQREGEDISQQSRLQHLVNSSIDSLKGTFVSMIDPLTQDINNIKNHQSTLHSQELDYYKKCYELSQSELKLNQVKMSQLEQTLHSKETQICNLINELKGTRQLLADQLEKRASDFEMEKLKLHQKIMELESMVASKDKTVCELKEKHSLQKEEEDLFAVKRKREFSEISDNIILNMKKMEDLLKK